MDRTTKVLLALIAAGLWANALPHLTGQVSAQSRTQSDTCLTPGDCLESINAWAANAGYYLGSIAADMKVLVAKAQENKAHVEPAAPVKPRATPAPPAPAKPSPCISGVC
jgi:hypothetical protein